MRYCRAIRISILSHLEMSTKRVLILGFLHREAFRFAKLRVTEKIKITPPEEAVENAPGADLLIILSHGGMDVDRNLARKINRPLILIGDHDQSLIKNGPGVRLNKNV